MKKTIQSNLNDQPTKEEQIKFIRDFYGDISFTGTLRDTLLRVAEKNSLEAKTFEYEYTYEASVGIELFMTSTLKTIAKVRYH